MRKFLQKIGGYSRALVVPRKMLDQMKWDEQKLFEFHVDGETLVAKARPATKEEFKKRRVK